MDELTALDLANKIEYHYNRKGKYSEGVQESLIEHLTSGQFKKFCKAINDKKRNEMLPPALIKNFNEKVLDSILSSRTSGITFSQILFNKNGSDTPMLEVRGVAKNRDSLRNFKTVLDSNSNFANVDLPVSNFLEKEDLSFNISILIK